MQQKQGLQAKKDFKERLKKIRSGFLDNDSSLNAFCKQQGFDYANTRKSILGIKKGKKAQEIAKIAEEASKGK
ncbi:MAG: hypothetical protein PHD53_00840 [Methylococcales bacterium]|nr:hypothetical protein [Methylococcales bacterium]